MLANVSKRGGRPKRKNVARKPGGQIDYDVERRHRARKQEVAEVRMRVYGLHRHDAESNLAQTVFGRLYLQGELGAVRSDKAGDAEWAYAAGEEFSRRWEANRAAIAAPSRPRSGSDMGYVPDMAEADRASIDAAPVRLTDAEYAAKCRDARVGYSDIRRTCLEADPLGLMALETIVVEDKMAESLIGPLRIACNAIARRLQAERRT